MFSPGLIVSEVDNLQDVSGVVVVILVMGVVMAIGLVVVVVGSAPWKSEPEAYTAITTISIAAIMPAEMSTFFDMFVFVRGFDFWYL